MSSYDSQTGIDQRVSQFTVVETSFQEGNEVRSQSSARNYVISATDVYDSLMRVQNHHRRLDGYKGSRLVRDFLVESTFENNYKRVAAVHHGVIQNAI